MAKIARAESTNSDEAVLKVLSCQQLSKGDPTTDAQLLDVFKEDGLFHIRMYTTGSIQPEEWNQLDDFSKALFDLPKSTKSKYDFTTIGRPRMSRQEINRDAIT